MRIDMNLGSLSFLLYYVCVHVDDWSEKIVFLQNSRKFKTVENYKENN